MRVLCVCLGNICRSPTAEAVLRAMDNTLVVDSAGTVDWNIGDPPYGPALAAAAKRGYDMRPRRARQFQQADFDRFDLILAMDGKNLLDIEAQRPAACETPVRLFLVFADGPADQDIPDPYHTRDFEGAIDLIEAAATGLLAALNRT